VLLTGVPRELVPTPASRPGLALGGLTRRLSVGAIERLIMPAFGSYTGALSVRSEAFEGLFGEFHVWMIGDKAVHRFPAAQVR
jgi:metallophosphoesterase superfamily enzyme